MRTYVLSMFLKVDNAERMCSVRLQWMLLW